MAENVKVIVRCRPMNKREIDLNCKSVVLMRNCVVETWDPNEGPSYPKQFTFDSTYDQDSNTETIYNDICYPLVESVLEGYNATIFVYGQTGCGKSFTMEGIKSANYTEKGVISRAFEHIFEAISVTSGVKYLALVSYLEIYNEQIRDLLTPSDKIGTNNNLSLKETPNEGVTVPGLKSYPVHNITECENYLNMGSKNRMIGATLMNQNSSRSHSIFTISIEQLSHVNNNESIRKGKLNLVDLAGSERQTKTGATGDRLKEATKINLSLSALGNVISALVDGKAKHIPYRDSKLTRLLQDSLGGNTRTLMIACVGPASKDYMETLSTLRYANRAKNIHNKPTVNEDPKDAILRQYQEEIERLRTLLDNQKNGGGNIEDLNALTEVNKNIESRNTNLDLRRDKLLQEYQDEMKKLKNLHESEKSEKENILQQIKSIKTEYEKNIQKLNDEMAVKHKKELCSEEEILNRIEVLKAAIIGGEKANDKELSERRKRKKLAAERRASVIAHLLAKIDMNEDREILQNQYKDITQELNLKTEALRRYRHKVKLMEKEVSDIQGEFEIERQDYLETIRKQDKNIKLLSQISGKIAATLKKECNYSDLESIKEQAIWLDDSQKYKLPDLIFPRTKLPPPETHGVPNISNIYGGYECPREAKNMMVSIYDKSRGTHICGGTMLTDKFILTAAHCFENSINDKRRLEIYHDQTVYKINRIHIHPKYAGLPFMYNDIAVVQLTTSVNKTRNELNFINLPRQKCHTDLVDICKEAEVMGWGMHSSVRKVSNYLRCATLQTIRKDECEEEMLYKDMWAEPLGLVGCTYHSDKLKNVCSGDSGGPLICGGVQIGIVSFGHLRACGKLVAPAGYTRVDCYLKFIYTVMKDAEGKNNLEHLKVDFNALEDIDYPSKTMSWKPKMLIITVYVMFNICYNRYLGLQYF